MKARYAHAKNEGRKFYNEVCKKMPYPLNLIYLLFSLNIKFENTNLYGEDGYILRNIKNGKYKIFFDYSVYGHRKRFTLAHEIAHIMLKHFEQFNVDTLTDVDLKELDREADTFAAEFLMPYAMIKRMPPDIYYLANEFMVTDEAMRTRLGILNIEPKQYNPFDTSVEDDIMQQLNATHEKWLYDF